MVEDTEVLVNVKVSKGTGVLVDLFFVAGIGEGQGVPIPNPGHGVGDGMGEGVGEGQGVPIPTPAHEVAEGTRKNWYPSDVNLPLKEAKASPGSKNIIIVTIILAHLVIAPVFFMRSLIFNFSIFNSNQLL